MGGKMGYPFMRGLRGDLTSDCYPTESADRHFQRESIECVQGWRYQGWASWGMQKIPDEA